MHIRSPDESLRGSDMNSQRSDKETRVREKIGARLGKPLFKKRLELTPGLVHEFDFVSEDGTVVGEVKTSETNKQRPDSQNLRTAQLGDFCRDCSLLLAARKASERIFVLTDKTVYERFLTTEYGKAAKILGIDIQHVPV